MCVSFHSTIDQRRRTDMVTRRRTLQLLLGAASAAGASPWAQVFAQGRPFTFCSFGGALSSTEKAAFMDPASKKFSAEIANVSPTNYAKIKAMVEAKAVEWDLVDVGGQFIYQGRDQGLLEKMDYSIIDASKIDKSWVSEYGVFTSVGATVLAYNTKAFPS